MPLTEEQVRALVTDPGTLKRGLEVVTPANWTGLGQTESAAWGECKGSGKVPYQVGLDLAVGAFRCSCPSRVFPCKHGAGLALLLAREPARFAEAEPPEWLTEWLGRRQQKQLRQLAPPAPAPAPVPASPEGLARTEAQAAATRARREAQKAARAAQAVAELDTFLLDVMRAGLAAAIQQPAGFWEAPAARLVDNGLPGLAARLRELPGLAAEVPTPVWPARLLAVLGEIYSLTTALRRAAALPPDLRAELAQQTGQPLRKEDVLAHRAVVTDTWYVLGRSETEVSPRLFEQRQWLWGQASNRAALVQEYAFQGARYGHNLLPGTLLRGALAFYPGPLPLRALVAAESLAPVPASGAPAAMPVTGPAGQLAAYAAALARNPWLRRWPMYLGDVVPALDAAGRWVLVHAAENAAMPLDACSSEQAGWPLLAQSGGEAVRVFGEWDGYALRVLWWGPVGGGPVGSLPGVFA